MWFWYIHFDSFCLMLILGRAMLVIYFLLYELSSCVAWAGSYFGFLFRCHFSYLLLELFQIVTFFKNVGLLLREFFWFEFRLKRHVKVSYRLIIFDCCSLFGLLLITYPNFRSANLLGTVNYIFDFSHRRGVLYHSLLAWLPFNA